MCLWKNPYDGLPKTRLKSIIRHFALALVVGMLLIGLEFKQLADLGHIDLNFLGIAVVCCTVSLCNCCLACTATGVTATGRAIMVQVRPASCTRACIVRGPLV
jgi:hypothetical protein